jgi:hypothetical protein
MPSISGSFLIIPVLLPRSLRLGILSSDDFRMGV